MSTERESTVATIGKMANVGGESFGLSHNQDHLIAKLRRIAPEMLALIIPAKAAK